MIASKNTPSRKTSNRFLLRFFSVALALVLIFVTIVFVIFFVTLRSRTIDQAFTTEQENIKNVTYSATLMEDAAFTLLSQFYNSSKVQQLIYKVAPTELESVSAMHLLSDLVVSSSWVDSAYVYSIKDQAVVFSYYREGEHKLSFSEVDEFWDREFLEYIEASPERSDMPPLRSITIPNTRTPKIVFTYYLPVQTVAHRYDGFYIVNIDAEKLIESCYGITGQDTREIILVDKNLHTYSNDTKLLTSDSRQELFNVVFSSQQSTGHCILDNEGEKVFCVWNTTEDFPYVFISCVPRASILGHLHPLSIIVILFYLVISIAVICSIGILSRRTNREYSNMQRLYSKATKEYQSTHNFIKDILLRNFFLAQKDYGLATKHFSENKIALERYSSYSLILLEIQSQKDILPKEIGVLQSPRVVLENILLENVSAMCRFEIVDMLKNRHLLILETYSSETVETVIRNVSASLRETYNYSCTGLYSTGLQSLEMLPPEYQALAKHFDALFFYPNQSFVDILSLENKAIVGYEQAEQVCKRIIHELKAQHFDQATVILSDFFESWFEPAGSIQKTTDLLIREFGSYISSFVELYTVTMEFDMKSYQSSINRCDNAAEVSQVFSNLIEDMRSVFAGIGQRSNYIDRVVELIHSKYSDTSFCIEDLANAVGVSTSHIQSVFKASTGVSIARYLRQYRLNKAADLLANTATSINDIAEQTGFGNANYFYTVFKKYYSITPSEYRSVQKSNQSVDP